MNSQHETEMISMSWFISQPCWHQSSVWAQLPARLWWWRLFLLARNSRQWWGQRWAGSREEDDETPSEQCHLAYAWPSGQGQHLDEVHRWACKAAPEEKKHTGKAISETGAQFWCIIPIFLLCVTLLHWTGIISLKIWKFLKFLTMTIFVYLL